MPKLPMRGLGKGLTKAPGQVKKMGQMAPNPRPFPGIKPGPASDSMITPGGRVESGLKSKRIPKKALVTPRPAVPRSK